jgi:type I restriction enzyme S subunit
MTQSKKGWRTLKLKGVTLVGAGNSAPQGIKFFERGTYPFIRTQDVGKLHIHPALSETTDYVNNLAIETKHLKLWPDKSLLILKSGASTFLNHRVLTAVPAYVASHLAVVVAGDQVLPEYLYFWSLTVDSRQIAPDNNYPSLRLSDLEEIELSVPPLPVQERIVQILQKTDKIRRKRKEALDLADKILKGIFYEFFGDLATNNKRWPVIALRELIEDAKNGIYKRESFYGSGIPSIRMYNIEDFRLNPEGAPLLAVSNEELQRYRLKPGDIIFNRVNSRELVGKCAVIPNTISDMVFESKNMRIRVNLEKADPFYVCHFLSFPCGRHELEKYIIASVNNASINQDGLGQVQIPLPPLNVQKLYSATIEKIEENRNKNIVSLMDMNALFAGLMIRAFSGSLTAEWEAANAAWIKDQVEARERLPRLLLLALIRECAARTGKNTQAAVLVTALMKYVFLLQMEGQSRQSQDRWFYHFIPYHYGPFAKEVYSDLRKLQQEGLIRVKGIGWNTRGASAADVLMVAEEQAPYETGFSHQYESARVEIGLDDVDNAERHLVNFPDDLKKDIVAIINAYGNLDHNTLLKTVYEKYPTYAKKSKVRRKTKLLKQLS